MWKIDIQYSIFEFFLKIVLREFNKGQNFFYSFEKTIFAKLLCFKFLRSDSEGKLAANNHNNNKFRAKKDETMSISRFAKRYMVSGIAHKVFAIVKWKNSVFALA